MHIAKTPLQAGFLSGVRFAFQDVRQQAHERGARHDLVGTGVAGVRNQVGPHVGDVGQHGHGGELGTRFQFSNQGYRIERASVQINNHESGGKGLCQAEQFRAGTRYPHGSAHSFGCAFHARAEHEVRGQGYYGAGARSGG